jgi:AraC-like DNA-binding protein
MEPASLEQFARDPAGRYVAGERYVHFCAAPTLWGMILWGRPTEADALSIGTSLRFEFGPPAVPHAAIIDASRLEGGDPAAFARVERFVAKYGEPLKASIVSLAMVRPTGLGGAIVTGAPAMLPFPYPVRVFDDVPTGLAWLAPITGLDPTETATMLGRAQERAAGTPKLIRELRVYLEANLDDAALATASRALAMSERSLQRKLAESGTTFQDEVSAARVRVAQRMLADPVIPLTEIAIAVGCASLQHFSALFKKVVGQTPSAWRKDRA